jgi:hypothetical protein
MLDDTFFGNFTLVNVQNEGLPAMSATLLTSEPACLAPEWGLDGDLMGAAYCHMI